MHEYDDFKYLLVFHSRTMGKETNYKHGVGRFLHNVHFKVVYYNKKCNHQIILTRRGFFYYILSIFLAYARKGGNSTNYLLFV